jgi:hypothetical protein
LVRGIAKQPAASPAKLPGQSMLENDMFAPENFVDIV